MNKEKLEDILYKLNKQNEQLRQQIKVYEDKEKGIIEWLTWTINNCNITNKEEYETMLEIISQKESAWW